MNRTFRFWLASIFSLFLCACVSQPQRSEFDAKQAAKARVELGLGYLAQQDFVRAKQNFDKALSYSSDFYLVHSALAYFYQTQGQIEQASKAYDTAIKLDPSQGDVLNNYGAFLCSQGAFEQAYLHFEQALKSQHYYQYADTYENMALCAFSQKNLQRYQQSVQNLMKMDAARARQLPTMKE
ncbi:type IV pilus biogenesis/stability protein PilW [Pasteurella sp. PK-2025]|uniref:type IV pilus biogenesis/stability protein PilW n=1 Tax=unclassified Pasteurella TaxID=2621516 RepID=UPI003C756901